MKTLISTLMASGFFLAGTLRAGDYQQDDENTAAYFNRLNEEQARRHEEHQQDLRLGELEERQREIERNCEKDSHDYYGR